MQRKDSLLNSLEHANSRAEFAVYIYIHIIHHSWLHFSTMLLVKVHVRIICFHHDDSSHKISFPYISPWNLAVCLNFQRPLSVAPAENEHIPPLGKAPRGWGSVNSQLAQLRGKESSTVSVGISLQKWAPQFPSGYFSPGRPIFWGAIYRVFFPLHLEPS